jgi:predicted HicB family RNase H-like nuclease
MKKPKRDMVLTPVRVERELLKELKTRAFNLNISLQKWLGQAIAEKMLREDKVK